MSSSAGANATRSADWAQVLAHRTDPNEAAQVRERFIAHGVAPDLVSSALQDGGAELASAVAGGRPDWAARYGGPLAAALIAAEVAAHSSHLMARASIVRSVAVDALLEDLSAVNVAAELGVSRQKVYEIARDSAQRRARLADLMGAHAGIHETDR